jgi:hypothetical protein
LKYHIIPRDIGKKHILGKLEGVGRNWEVFGADGYNLVTIRKEKKDGRPWETGAFLLRNSVSCAVILLQCKSES